MSNSLYTIGNMYIKTRDRQAPFCSHICPYRRGETYPPFGNHFLKSRLQFRLIQSLSSSCCDTIYGTLYTLSFEQIPTIEDLFRFFIKPPNLIFLVHYFCFLSYLVIYHSAKSLRAQSYKINSKAQKRFNTVFLSLPSNSMYIWLVGKEHSLRLTIV